VASVLFARVDKIGDLILTLPCEELWRRERPNDSIHWLVSDSLKFVIDHAESHPQTQFVSNKKLNFFAGFSAAWTLSRVLREKNVSDVIAFYVPWWVALSFWLARIKNRTGVASQWYSWLFYNHRIRQRRSLATQHESAYNADLVCAALSGHVNVKASSPIQPLKLVVSENEKQKARELLQSLGLRDEKFVVIHPGMAGSARNWLPSSYRELAKKILAKNISVVVTGGGLVDEDYIQQTDILSLQGVVSVVNKTSGSDLLGVLSLASVVVAPSTGVAHLAASLEKPIAGLYSPVRVQAPKRWGPLGKNVRVFTPPFNSPAESCPGTMSCLYEKCPFYDCMKQIPVDTVFNYVMDNL